MVTRTRVPRLKAPATDAERPRPAARYMASEGISPFLHSWHPTLREPAANVMYRAAGRGHSASVAVGDDLRRGILVAVFAVIAMRYTSIPQVGEKWLAVVAASDSCRGMIRGGFLDPNSRADLIALVRDGRPRRG